MNWNMIREEFKRLSNIVTYETRKSEMGYFKTFFIMKKEEMTHP